MKNKSGNSAFRYMGLGAQFIAAIGLGLYGGAKADVWLGLSGPMLIWILPLILIIGMLIKIVVDTSKK